MESGNTELNNTVNAKRGTNPFILRALEFEYVHKTKMAYNKVEVPWAWLLVVLSKDFLVKGTVPARFVQK